MPYACRSWGKAAGAFGATAGSVNLSAAVNLSDPEYDLPGEAGGFGDEHGGEFNAAIQHLQPFFTDC